MISARTKAALQAAKDAMREPGESYSEIILRLVEIEAKGSSPHDATPP